MANLKAVYERPLRTLDDLGGELAFFLRALAWTPRTVVRYQKEILRILAEVTLGSGEASPMTMALSFATLAANGVYCEPYPVTGVTNTAGESVMALEPACEQVVAIDGLPTSGFGMSAFETRMMTPTFSVPVPNVIGCATLLPW